MRACECSNGKNNFLEVYLAKVIGFYNVFYFCHSQYDNFFLVAELEKWLGQHALLVLLEHPLNLQYYFFPIIQCFHGPANIGNTSLTQMAGKFNEYLSFKQVIVIEIVKRIINVPRLGNEFNRIWLKVLFQN